MGTFIKGEVVVVPFPYSNLENVTKRRPALVIASLSGDDVILCQITSHNRHDSYSISLTNADFRNGNLQIDSYIRPNRLFTADSNIIVRSAGNIKLDKINEVIDGLKQIIEA